MHADVGTVILSLVVALIGSGSVVTLFLNAHLARQSDAVKGATAALEAGYTASNERRLECIKALWDNVLEMRHFAANLIYIYDVFEPGDYPADQCVHIQLVLTDINPCDWLEKFLEVVEHDESHRPFIGEHLWQQYAVYRAFMGGACVKLLKAREIRQIPKWDQALSPEGPDTVGINAGTDDGPLKNALLSVLEKEELDECTQGCKGVPRKIMTTIEGKMMACINDWVLGAALANMDPEERSKRYRELFDPAKLTRGRNAILETRQSAELAIGIPIV